MPTGEERVLSSFLSLPKRLLRRRGRLLFLQRRFFLEGDPAPFVGVVLLGTVQIIREDYYGNRITVAKQGLFW